ncbi:hypothetical protein C364_05819 [Cryptococcus neoformans Bt63]|nr:hypothetical protein C364_05819 [Cryptococcus neoformans var. grubii Bt63]
MLVIREIELSSSFGPLEAFSSGLENGVQELSFTTVSHPPSSSHLPTNTINKISSTSFPSSSSPKGEALGDSAKDIIVPPEFTDNQPLPALENSSTSRVSSNLNVTPHHVQTNGGMSRSLSAFPEFVVITLIGIAIACCSIPLLMCIAPFVRRGARRSSTTSSDELVGKGGNQSMISMYSSMFSSRSAPDFPSNGSWRSDSSTASTIDTGSHKSEHSIHDIGQGYGDSGLGIKGSKWVV